MERELWPRLYHLVMEVGTTVNVANVTFQPHIVVLVLLWAALHDRPRSWACHERNWATTTLRPAGLPSPSCLSRRLRGVATGVLMRAVEERLRRSGDPRLIALIDGKPLPIGGAGGDPDAGCGRGAGMWDKGYKLFAVWGGRPMPEAWRIYPMNESEVKVGVELAGDLHGGGYLLGDGEYDANDLYDAAGAAGYQLVAPREDPGAGLGHHYQSPFRLRSIALLATAFGRGLYALRGGIERSFAALTSFGGGLSPLPSWVRRLHRVWCWTWAKLVINGVRITMNQGLALNMQ